MIRGSIEVAQRTRVAGWIYASAEPLRDKLILAFHGPRCIGSGKVDKFRKDLLEAKLGDGFCGFDFPIKLIEGEKLGAVVVRLQNSDAALIQPNTRLSGPADEAEDAPDQPDLGAISPQAVVWMQDRGMLEQGEYDFLRAVQTLGAYERSLRAPRKTGTDTQLVKPETAIAELLSLYTLGEVTLRTHHVRGISDLAGENGPLRQPGLSVVGIWAEERTRVTLDERSHTGPKPARGQILTTPPLGGIDYSFGPDRVLFLHRDCSLAPQGPAPAHGLRVATATRRSTVTG